ncbi:hypothetical protein B0H13DRAFT_1874422 [Mycena leptocephala]|nr:hypothetical protein B0H13DRAFT_1874422 [Mycena leptocephala]
MAVLYEPLRGNSGSSGVYPETASLLRGRPPYHRKSVFQMTCGTVGTGWCMCRLRFPDAAVFDFPPHDFDGHPLFRSPTRSCTPGRPIDALFGQNIGGIMPSRTQKAPVGSYLRDIDDGEFTLKWSSLGEMQIWLRAEERKNTIEFVFKEARPNKNKRITTGL